MEKIDRIKAKVRRVLLEEFGSLEIENEDSFLFECNDALVSVGFIQHDPSDEEGRVFLEFSSLVAYVEVAGDSLYRWIARNGAGFLIGTFVIEEIPPGANVFFRYRMLGDDVDPSEIYVASYAVAETASGFSIEFIDDSDIHEAPPLP